MTTRSPETDFGPWTASLPGSFNFRDLGRTALGARLELASGRFYRSGNPSQLAPAAAVGLARAIGLRTVIDLRTTAERKQCGLADLPSSKCLHHPLFEEALPHWIAPADQSPSATAMRYVEMLRAGAPAIAGIVRAICDREAQPFLIYCAAGRDRTGIVVACLLDLLGAEEAAIASDYALSDAVLEDGGRAHSQTIVQFLTLVREHHGSTRELLSPHGVSAEVVTKLSSSLAVSYPA